MPSSNPISATTNSPVTPPAVQTRVIELLEANLAEDARTLEGVTACWDSPASTTPERRMLIDRLADVVEQRKAYVAHLRTLQG